VDLWITWSGAGRRAPRSVCVKRGLEAGWRHPYLAYEIEVVDADGRTLYVGVVDPSRVKLVESYGHGDCG
jgi:hypothetical protein